MVEEINKEFAELTVTQADVSAIIKPEDFANIIITEAEKGRRLAGIIAASEININKGDSDVVSVMIFPKIPVDAVGEAVDADTGDTYKPMKSQVTIKRYAKAIRLTHQSIYHANTNLVARVLNAIAQGWAEKMDKEILDKLDLGKVTETTYKPGVKVELAAAGDLTDIYDKIVEAADALRYGKGLNPDVLVIGKDVKAQLIKDYKDATKRYLIDVGPDGEIRSVYGLKVIVSPLAPPVGTTAGEVVAVVLDSSQALVEAWGAGPKFEEERDAATDTYQEVFNVYWGVNVITADFDGDGTAEAFGIAQITNPTA